MFHVPLFCHPNFKPFLPEVAADTSRSSIEGRGSEVQGPSKDRQNTFKEQLQAGHEAPTTINPEIYGELVQDPCRFDLKPPGLYDTLFVHNRYSLACALKL